MRWTLISFLCIFNISIVAGQKNELKDKIEGQSSINIGLDDVIRRFTPPFSESQVLKSASISHCNINVTYVNFPDNAKVAFDYAISIWEEHINSSIPISILAKWENLGNNILALSQPSEYHKNFDAAPIPDVYYPISLVEKLSEKEWNTSKDADIICSFNSSSPWYFKTDGNTLVTDYDFVTAVLHEIAHGLGISGFITQENGQGLLNNPGDNPSIYDYFIYNSQNQRVTDKSIFDRPSLELYNQLTSNNLDFGRIGFVNYEKLSSVFAPESWVNGASIYHLGKFQSSTTDPIELMSPYLHKGEAIHNPGERTLAVLSELGWNENSFQLTQIKDREDSATELEIETTLMSDQAIDKSSIKIIYSTNNFLSSDTAIFSFNNEKQNFKSKLGLNNYKGNILYYFTANTINDQSLIYPKQAPENLLNFKIGIDYFSPQLKHNPSRLVLSSNPELSFKAIASDNLGIGSVKVDYQINGISQESLYLSNYASDIYTGKLSLPNELKNNDKVEYRIIAEDISSRRNIKILPAQGYYKIEVYETFEALTGYSSDFNSYSNDFTTSDFKISVPAGFNNALLHTNNPYPISELTDEKFNVIAQLNHPIKLEDNGIMSFDEIVLVEPGKLGTTFTEALFSDYVIVEGSKNGGETWHAFVEGYDSAINEDWQNKFTGSLKSGASSVSIHENMFWEQEINLTDNPFFSAEDTVVIRFRLSSDNSISGWGWAIDNLKIQSLSTNAENLQANTTVNVYPNPCTDHLYLDCVKLTTSSSVQIVIADLTGKTVHQETKYDVLYNPKIKIDISKLRTGIYLASITDSELNKFTQKIIKN